MNREATVNIDSMAFGGYGVARTEGKIAFIPYSIKGEKAKIEIVQEKKDYSIGRVSEIIAPSPHRVEPPCPYFGVCGGCQWQHIDEAAQGRFKREILEDSLARIGGLKEFPSISVIPAPAAYGYRARVQLKVKGKSFGYFQERSHRVVDIDCCIISRPLVNEIIRSLRKDLSFLFQMKEVEISVSPEEERAVLILHTPRFDTGLVRSLTEFLRNHNPVKGIALTGEGRTRFLGDPFLNLTISYEGRAGEETLRFRVSPESFFQVNPEQNRRLIQSVLDFSETKETDRVLELYSGIGNFSFPLALAGGEVAGVEENEAAVEDARFNADQNGLKCRFIHGRAEEILEKWEERPDLMVLDPPRAGCKSILDQIVRLEPGRIVYVSCDPATLSRDLRLLSGRGYGLQKLSLIDMFPQSYHMEVVGLLTH